MSGMPPGPRVLGLHVGRAAPLDLFGAPARSAIAKRPAAGPVALGPEGLAGDEQADRRHHGGPDKAVCVYPSEHYERWMARLGRALPAAAFGENLSTRGLLEDEVRIGAVWRLGGAVVQVSQPRIPCRKLAARLGEDGVQAEVQRSGLTGWYLRVLEPGAVAAGAAVEVLEPAEAGASVRELNRLLFRDRGDRAGLERALASAGLMPYWRERLQAALAEATAAG